MGKTNDSPSDVASEKARLLEITIAECDQKIQAARERCPSYSDLDKLEMDVRVSVEISKVSPAEALERQEKIARKVAAFRQQVDEWLQEIARAKKDLQGHLGDARSEIERILANS